MRAIIEDILTLPYYKNYAAASGAVHNVAKHEDAVEGVLIKHGLPKITRDEYEAGAVGFVDQPNGTHNAPDFWVREAPGQHHDLECKSVKGKSNAAPMFNSGIPKPDMIYVFCCERYDETTVFFGRDIMDTHIKSMMEEHIAKRREEDAAFNLMLRENRAVTEAPIEWYTRPMMVHKGGDDAGADYFKNTHRHTREQNVLNSFS